MIIFDFYYFVLVLYLLNSCVEFEVLFMLYFLVFGFEIDLKFIFVIVEVGFLRS